MLDPLLSLALNVASTRGGYALLLGSGISRAAGIPTGWDIVLDLIAKLAVATGVEPLPDPETWYRTTYHQDPDYSAIIDSIGGTEEERRQLLRGYFEPTVEERTQGLKTPTAAHRSIAQLAARGHVRVVVTTNFDRLLEQALEAEGITPTVISTADMAAGALPIVHTPCTIIKVHGDYMDTRIKNTAAELAAYDRRIDDLLDEVIDTFGLIVCGWSATWDPALRAALDRAPTRRFTTYWATRGAPTPEATQVIQHRQAAVLPIEGADQFFQALAEKVQALEDLREGNPLTARVAAATLKRLLDEDRQIRAYDLVTEEIVRLRGQIDDVHFPPNAPYSPGEFRRRLKQYETLSEAPEALLAACGYWAKPGQERIWRQAVPALADFPLRGGVDVWLELSWYPALLVLCAGGLAAIAARNDHVADHSELPGRGER